MATTIHSRLSNQSIYRGYATSGNALKKHEVCLSVLTFFNDIDAQQNGNHTFALTVEEVNLFLVFLLVTLPFAKKTFVSSRLMNFEKYNMKRFIRGKQI